VDLLVCACQHLFSLPQTTWRAAVAAHIYMSHILPVFRVFIALEEDAQLLALASAGTTSLSAVENETILHSRVHAGQIQVRLISHSYWCFPFEIRCVNRRFFAHC
jgi:hypothetical protein